MGHTDEGATIAHIRIPIATQYNAPGHETQSPIDHIIRDHSFDPGETGAFYALFNREWLKRHRTSLPERLYGAYFRVRPGSSTPGTNCTVPKVEASFLLHRVDSQLTVNGVKYANGGYLTREEITGCQFEGDRHVIALLPWAIGRYNNLLTVVREVTEERLTLYIGPASPSSLHHLPLEATSPAPAYCNEEFTFHVANAEHTLRKRDDTWVLDGSPITPLNPSPYIFLIGQDDILFIL